ncbi:DUF2927 domain-containing protein [Thiomicrorhabdus hydrogeniphila]
MKWINCTKAFTLNSKQSAFKLLSVFLCFFGSLAQAQPEQSDARHHSYTAWQNPQYILKSFEEIALKNEYKKTQQRILKWQHPIRYQFKYKYLKPNKLVENLFTIHLKHLADITGLDIKLATKVTKANFLIYLTIDKHYGEVIRRYTQSKVKNIQRDSQCMGNFKTNNHNEITHADVILPVDHDYSRGLLVSCVVEETTQVLGLPNDASWVNPSIANDDSKIELLTGLDYILLKLLYNPEIKAGMPEKQSRKILKKEIKRLIDNGAVKKAAQTVNSTGLYQAVN